MITTSSPTELKIARRAMGRRGQARSRKPDKGFCEDLASPAPALAREANAMAYSIRIRRKTGIWQTEPAIRRGSPPKLDDEIEVNLRGETVKARVNAITTNPSKAKGDPALEVHTEEI